MTVIASGIAARMKTTAANQTAAAGRRSRGRRSRRSAGRPRRVRRWRAGSGRRRAASRPGRPPAPAPSDRRSRPARARVGADDQPGRRAGRGRSRRSARPISGSSPSRAERRVRRCRRRSRGTSARTNLSDGNLQTRIARLRRSRRWPTQELRNPFQYEEDAFRVLVIIVVAAAIVIAAAVLVSTTLGRDPGRDRDRPRALEDGRLAERRARRARRRVEAARGAEAQLPLPGLAGVVVEELDEQLQVARARSCSP